MGWERRRNGFFYYAKQRQGSRVISRYLGKGGGAQLASDEIESDRIARVDGRSALAALAESESKTDEMLAAVESSLSEMTRAALIQAGFHQHRGQWRKKRYGS